MDSFLKTTFILNIHSNRNLFFHFEWSFGSKCSNCRMYQHAFFKLQTIDPILGPMKCWLYDQLRFKTVSVCRYYDFQQVR